MAPILDLGLSYSSLQRVCFIVYLNALALLSVQVFSIVTVFYL